LKEQIPKKKVYFSNFWGEEKRKEKIMKKKEKKMKRKI